MKKEHFRIFTVFLTALLLLYAKSSGRENAENTMKKTEAVNSRHNNLEDKIKNIYSHLNAENCHLNYEAFRYAMIGHTIMQNHQQLKNKNIISIIDFTQNSCQKRFFTIDLFERKIVFNTLVSHGQKSGGNVCTKFSNKPESHQSSIGFYITGKKYIGKHGESLRLHGNEEGYNSNVFNRAVVIHGADYVSESYIKNNGRIGRSYGCPALPRNIHREVINTIKDGSLIFAYYKDKEYLQSSKYLKSPS